MLDVRDPENGKDLVIADEATWKARNVLTTQIGDKAFVPDNFGLDLNFFLTSNYDLAMASFQSYAVKRLIAHRVNVVEVITTIQTLTQKMAMQVGDQPQAEGFISL